MPTDESDLWPSDLAVDVLSPLMILNEQAEALSKKTGGIVKGEVLPGVAGAFAQLSFDLVAPAVGFRQRLLFARYSNELPYPLVLISEPLLSHRTRGGIIIYPDSATWKLSDHERAQSRIAYTPDDVRDLLKYIFNSPTTRAVLFSLVARSNEVKPSLQNESKQSVEPPTGSGTVTDD